MMKALVCKEYGPPGKLVIEDYPDPIPAEGEVLVDIKAAGINFPDVLLIAGTYQVKVPPPFVPGNEAAGIVEAVGEGVAGVKPGDRVTVECRKVFWRRRKLRAEAEMKLDDGTVVCSGNVSGMGVMR